jgi:hypothetical protein
MRQDVSAAYADPDSAAPDLCFGEEDLGAGADPEAEA